MESSQNKLKIDPLTGEEFMPKSRVQRFAKPANQKKYNNLKSSKQRSDINNNLRPLLENEKVLKRILGDDESIVVSRDFLDGAGFDFKSCNGVEIINEKIWQFVMSFRIAGADSENLTFEIQRSYGRDIES